MKLNLGCGKDLREGYVNVDLHPFHPSIQVMDLSVLPWGFGEGSSEEILMLDFLEHFPHAQTKSILLECFRVLKTGGELIVQVPDADHVCRAFLGIGVYMCNVCGWKHSGSVAKCSCGQTIEGLMAAAVARMYGGQDYVGNFHQTMFDWLRLNQLMQSSGFKFIEDLEVDHQRANWNLKVRYRKDSLW